MFRVPDTQVFTYKVWQIPFVRKFRDVRFRDVKFRDVKFRDAKFRDAKSRDAKFRDVKFRDFEFKSDLIQASIFIPADI